MGRVRSKETKQEQTEEQECGVGERSDLAQLSWSAWVSMTQFDNLKAQ